MKAKTRGMLRKVKQEQKRLVQEQLELQDDQRIVDAFGEVDSIETQMLLIDPDLEERVMKNLIGNYDKVKHIFWDLKVKPTRKQIGAALCAVKSVTTNKGNLRLNAGYKHALWSIPPG